MDKVSLSCLFSDGHVCMHMFKCGCVCVGVCVWVCVCIHTGDRAEGTTLVRL